MFQYSVHKDASTFQLHHDAGAMSRWIMVDTKEIKMNFHGRKECSTNIADSTTKKFLSDHNFILNVGLNPEVIQGKEYTPELTLFIDSLKELILQTHIILISPRKNRYNL